MSPTLHSGGFLFFGNDYKLRAFSAQSAFSEQNLSRVGAAAAADEVVCGD